MTAKQGSKPRCFVISQIGADSSPERRHADLVLTYIIKAALPNLVVQRADEFGGSEMITDIMIAAIADADLAIADLTGNNPNVYYELGLRHMEQRPVIHIAQVGTPLPFDVKGMGTIFYDIGEVQSHASARDKIAAGAKAMMEKGYKVSNPVTAARASIAIHKSADTRDMVIDRLTSKVNSLETLVRESLSRTALLPSPAVSFATSGFNPSIPLTHSSTGLLPRSPVDLAAMQEAFEIVRKRDQAETVSLQKIINEAREREKSLRDQLEERSKIGPDKKDESVL